MKMIISILLFVSLVLPQDSCIISNSQRDISRNEFTYPDFSVELISYISKYKSGEIKLVDHDKYEWVKINRLKDFDFLDGDLPIIIRKTAPTVAVPTDVGISDLQVDED